jgi:parvulin-like peptidyl-prolyl isomerase
MFKKYEVKNLGELDARLRMLGSSWRAVKEQAAEQEIAKFGVMSQVTIDTEISHDELYQQYLNQRENYTMDNQVRWEHLLVSFASEPDRANAKRKLGRMGNEVVYGAKFSEVAKKDSSGFFAASGGYNDWTKRGALTNQILEEQIFTTPVGRLSDIFESPQGYHIIRVIEHQEAGYVPFEEVQDTIREGMLDERQSVAANGLMEKIKNKIPYEILVEGVKF